MRVLHMIPDIGISNGVMSVILNYAKAMPDDIKYDVVYFSDKDKTRQADIESLGGRVYKIDAPSPKDLLTGKMNTFFEKHKNEWSALHIHCPHFAIFIAPYAKKAGINKICVHCHTTEYSLSGNGKRNKLLSLYAKHFIKDKFACSKQSGKLWYGNKKFTVLNNAVNCRELKYDKDIHSNVKDAMGLDNAFVIGHIGKTDIRQKNHPFILKIFAKIKSQKENAKLLLIGANETLELKQLCTELCIEEDVSFLGMRSDIPALLQACDVFLFPSTSEGLPLSVIEAQASGLPVIMSDVITDELIATDSVSMVSLDDNEDIWAQKVITASESNRKDTLDDMIKNGWDIFSCGKGLAEYYNG